jgi:hypothetical protein
MDCMRLILLTDTLFLPKIGLFSHWVLAIG